jgi:hypothetical protein
VELTTQRRILIGLDALLLLLRARNIPELEQGHCGYVVSL